MFEYHLSTEEITHALKQGRKRAQGIINNPACDFEKQFDLVVQCTDQLLENFDREKFVSRGNINLKQSRLRKLILNSFKSVQTLRDLAPYVQSSKQEVLMDVGEETTRHIQLLKAATVFRTKGISDEPALDVGQVLRDYQVQQLRAA